MVQVLQNGRICKFVTMPYAAFSEVVSISKLSRGRSKPRKCYVRPAKTDQPGHPPSLIRVFAVRLKQQFSLSAWGLLFLVLCYQLSAQRRHWSNLAYAQADLILRWAQRTFCWFCHEAAQNASFSSLNMQHIYISSRLFTFCIKTNTKSFSHANNIIFRRYFIYIV